MTEADAADAGEPPSRTVQDKASGTQAPKTCAATTKDPDATIEACTRMLGSAGQSWPGRAIALTNRGRAWKAKRELDRAISDFSEAIRLDPNSVYAYLDRADIYRVKDRCDEAIADYDQVIRLRPERAATYMSRGACWLRKGEYERARADQDQASKLEGALGVATNRTLEVAPATPPAPVSLPQSAPTAEERRDYELAERVGTVEAWDWYLTQYAQGFYSGLARAQRAKLGGAALGAGAAQPTAPRIEPAPVAGPLPPPELAKQQEEERRKVEAERQRTEQDVMARREEAERAKAAEVERQRIERQQAEREALRRQQQEQARAAEAERRRIEQEKAEREEEEKRAKAAEVERQRIEREKAEREAARRGAASQVSYVGAAKDRARRGGA